MKKKLSLIVLGIFNVCMLTWAQTPYQLPKLPYEYNSLEPHIDAQTMEIHHSKHHAAYIKNLNTALQSQPYQNLPLTDLFKNISNYSDAVRNNAGGHYNHSLFWSILTPKQNTQPSIQLQNAIVKQFGTLDSLKKTMQKQAMSKFGSGWVWLIVTDKYELKITTTSNQDNPLMNIVEQKGTPILAIDVWEHAYHLKYQNKRVDYLTAIWNVINWEEVSRLYRASLPAIENWTALTAAKNLVPTINAKNTSNVTIVALKTFETSPTPVFFESDNTKLLKVKMTEMALALENKNKPKADKLELMKKEILDLISKIEQENK